MRFADRKTYTVAQDVANLLDGEKDASNVSPRAARRAFNRAEKLMYDSVGTDEHTHWIQVRNELATLAASV